jgi:hypothetical protein
VQKVQPNFTASEGQLIGIPSRLPDWPNHAEISDGRPARSRVFFEDGNSAACFRRYVSMGKANNSRTYNGNVCLMVYHVLVQRG